MNTRENIADFGLAPSATSPRRRVRARIPIRAIDVSPLCREKHGRKIWAKLILTLLGFSGLFSTASAWELPKASFIVGRESTVAVSSGETLYDIARRHGYALEHLAEANDLPVSMQAVARATVLIPSRRILPTDPPSPGLVVNLPERGFYVFGGAKEARFFPIAVGEPGRFATPTGSFSIVEKVEDPDWIAPEWAGLGENNVIAAGPDNPLGDRWIGLSWSGLGMHSTNNPLSIGSASSHGCMRMYPEIARIVFDLVKTGWPVRIEYETARLALESSGIFVSAFPDIYSRGHDLERIRERFRAEDLSGFFQSKTVNKVLEAKRGVPVKVVDLEPKAQLGKQVFAAARIDGVLYVEQSLLEAAGVQSKFSLTESDVQLTRGTRELTLNLYLHSQTDRSPEQAFLSRGSGWYPARKTLTGLGFNITWEADSNRLKVDL